MMASSNSSLRFGHSNRYLFTKADTKVYPNHTKYTNVFMHVSYISVNLFENEKPVNGNSSWSLCCIFSWTDKSTGLKHTLCGRPVANFPKQPPYPSYMTYTLGISAIYQIHTYIPHQSQTNRFSGEKLSRKMNSLAIFPYSHNLFIQLSNKNIPISIYV